jgi:hypothetical protein
MSPFDAEFDSASIGTSFNDGKTFGENPEGFLCSTEVSWRTLREILVLQNVFPSIETSPFDSEFNSASNGVIFIYGKTIRKIFS